MLLNIELKVLTSKSRSASSWFCMIGRVFRSFSGFIVLITPSILQSKRHTFTRYRDLSTTHCIVATIQYCFKGPKEQHSMTSSRTTVFPLLLPPATGKRSNRSSSSHLTLFSFWWSQLLQVYMKVLFHSSICCIA